MHSKELLLNAGEGPPTLQSTVIPPWNYAPQLPGKVTPTSSPIVNATRKWKRTCTGFTRISPGSPQDRHKRTCWCWSGSWKIFHDTRTFQEPLTRDFIQAPLQRPFTGCRQDLHNIFSQGCPQDLGQDLHRSRTSEANGDNRFLRACAIKMHMDISKGTVSAKKKFNGNAADHDRAAHLVRACAVEMHTEISQGTFVREFTMKSQGPQSVPGSNTGL